MLLRDILLGYVCQECPKAPCLAKSFPAHVVFLLPRYLKYLPLKGVDPLGNVAGVEAQQTQDQRRADEHSCDVGRVVEAEAGKGEEGHAEEKGRDTSTGSRVGETTALVHDLGAVEKRGEVVEERADGREDRIAFTRRSAATTASRFSSKSTHRPRSAAGSIADLSPRELTITHSSSPPKSPGS